jgi:hypothetical protein
LKYKIKTLGKIIEYVQLRLTRTYELRRNVFKKDECAKEFAPRVASGIWTKASASFFYRVATLPRVAGFGVIKGEPRRCRLGLPRALRARFDGVLAAIKKSDKVCPARCGI